MFGMMLLEEAVPEMGSFFFMYQVLWVKTNFFVFRLPLHLLPQTKYLWS